MRKFDFWKADRFLGVAVVIAIDEPGIRNFGGWPWPVRPST